MKKEVRVVIENIQDESQKAFYLEPLNDEDDYILLEDVHGDACWHFLVNEGYVNTHYWYSKQHWYIKELAIID